MSFKLSTSRPQHALVLVYDLAGFSQFFSQPDVQDYVPRFLNYVSDALTIVFNGGEPYWEDSPNEDPPLLAPIHQKFLGDGALFLWSPDGGGTQFDPQFLSDLLLRLWWLKTRFSRVVEQAKEDVPIADLPSQIRFGLARGTVYRLGRQNSMKEEYIGYPINLASRLQNYCPDLGMLISARVGIPAEDREINHWAPVIASNLRGFPRELVLVDQGEFDRLPTNTRDGLFDKPK